MSPTGGSRPRYLYQEAGREVRVLTAVGMASAGVVLEAQFVAVLSLNLRWTGWSIDATFVWGGGSSHASFVKLTDPGPQMWR